MMIKAKHRDGYRHKLTEGKEKEHKGYALPLNETELLLWQKVAATVRPLPRQQCERVSRDDRQDFCDVVAHDDEFLTVPSFSLSSLPQPLQKPEAIKGRKNYRSSLDRAPVGVSPVPRAERNSLETQSCPNSLFSPHFYSENHFTHMARRSSRKMQRKMAHQHFDQTTRLDLHGLNADAAYDLLLRFIRANIVRNQSLVLVITGKGRSMGSVGILRQSVPQWLASAPFRPYIGAIEVAARHHGGEGAFYVRLRRLNFYR